jgi:hypothetical protein
MARIEEREEGGWKFLLRETSLPQKRLPNFIPKKFCPSVRKALPKLGGVELLKLVGVVRAHNTQN